MVKCHEKISTICWSINHTACGRLYLLVHTVMPKYIKQAIPQMQQLAAEYINGSVSIGGLKWEGGLTAELTDVVVRMPRVRRWPSCRVLCLRCAHGWQCRSLSVR